MAPNLLLGPVGQSVASLTADPGITSLIPARSHTVVEFLFMGTYNLHYFLGPSE